MKSTQNIQTKLIIMFKTCGLRPVILIEAVAVVVLDGPSQSVSTPTECGSDPQATSESLDLSFVHCLWYKVLFWRQKSIGLEDHRP